MKLFLKMVLNILLLVVRFGVEVVGVLVEKVVVE